MGGTSVGKNQHIERWVRTKLQKEYELEGGGGLTSGTERFTFRFGG